MSVTVQLGPYAFSNLEIPESINGGGKQMTGVHQLIGGNRSINTMGANDDPISWGGLFFGNDSLLKVRFLDTVRRLGSMLTFSYSEFFYNVVISSFTFRVEREYQIRYNISLLVVSDLIGQAIVNALETIDSALLKDIEEAMAIAVSVGNGSIIAALGNIYTAVKNVPSFSSASSATVNGISKEITNAQSLVNGAINALS